MSGSHMRVAAAAVISLLASACSGGGQIEAMPAAARVQPVLPPYAGLERCVGEIIDQSYPAPMLEILVPEIEDHTSKLFNPALSAAGVDWANAMLVHLANKVKVPAVNAGSVHLASDPNQLLVFKGVISGYDRVVNSKAGAMKIRFGGVELRLAGDTSYDLISGDFTWRRNGSPHIQGGISLIVAVQTRSGEGDVYLQDTKDMSRGIASTVRVQSIEGVHQSQRAMVEFGVLAMLAQATGIALADCADRALPGVLDQTNKAFRAMPLAQRYQETQTLLKKLGYYKAVVDRRWGPLSQSALNRFLLDHSMPPTSGLAAEHYVSLVLADRKALRP